jgi:hypothetical protein
MRPRVALSRDRGYWVSVPANSCVMSISASCCRPLFGSRNRRLRFVGTDREGNVCGSSARWYGRTRRQPASNHPCAGRKVKSRQKKRSLFFARAAEDEMALFFAACEQTFLDHVALTHHRSRTPIISDRSSDLRQERPKRRNPAIGICRTGKDQTGLQQAASNRREYIVPLGSSCPHLARSTHIASGRTSDQRSSRVLNRSRLRHAVRIRLVEIQCHQDRFD